MKIKKILTIIILLLIAYSLFMVSDSQAGFELQVDYPTIQGAEASTELAGYIRYLYLFGLSAVGIVALGSLVIGGFLYMGADTVTTKDRAREYIQGAILGLLIGLGAYLILNTINPDLLKNKPPTLPTLPTQPTTQTQSVTQPTVTANTRTYTYIGANYNTREKCENAKGVCGSKGFIGVIFTQPDTCKIKCNK
ncbi:hypothetical protein KKE13_00835 [Patescibacteria group bacterium]|nr:hypothetical protein [Patescibacteria group bacterium]